MAARAICGCGWAGTYSSPARARAMGGKHVCKTDDGVRRTTRRHRCARCGLVAVYENAGAAEARHWFGKHSCAKREQALLRTALHADRMALVDRTPQPCLHKKANHQHGERATYILDKCRCEPCREANRLAQSERVRLKAYGRYHKYVTAEHVRAHLAELKEYGIGLKRVSEVSGISNGSLTKIWYGLYADTGRGSERRHGEGKLIRGPSRRVLRATAEAIYAVEPIPANLGPRQSDHERTPLARSHVRALVALGWSISKIGDRLGITRGNMQAIVCSDRGMARQTVDRIESLFAELCMTLPPETDSHQRAAASRSRRYAAERGWPPPLGLDDLDLSPDQRQEAS